MFRPFTGSFPFACTLTLIRPFSRAYWLTCKVLFKLFYTPRITNNKIYLSAFPSLDTLQSMRAIHLAYITRMAYNNCTIYPPDRAFYNSIAHEYQPFFIDSDLSFTRGCEALHFLTSYHKFDSSSLLPKVSSFDLLLFHMQLLTSWHLSLSVSFFYFIYLYILYFLLYSIYIFPFSLFSLSYLPCDKRRSSVKARKAAR